MRFGLGCLGGISIVIQPFGVVSDANVIILSNEVFVPIHGLQIA